MNNPDIYPSVDPAAVGWITEQQMIELDSVMIDGFGIGLLQMMENAGRNLARVVLDLFSPATVAVVCGSGGNGGGGLAAARHLVNAGAQVVVTMSRPEHDLSDATRHQFETLRHMGVEVSDSVFDAAVCIDALIGYSLRGAPQGRVRELITQLNDHRPVVALDAPSGVDVTTGESPGTAVVASITLTLALPKIGLRTAPQVGELLLADISVPRQLTAELGGPPDYSSSPILRSCTFDNVSAGQCPRRPTDRSARKSCSFKPCAPAMAADDGRRGGQQ